VRTSLPGLNKPQATSLGQAKPAATQGNDEEWKGVELGKLDDGTVITIHSTGKYGPHVKAYIPATKQKVFANLPKGAAPEQIDLATAVGLIEQKMAA
jgi:topoisomerase IA-like protein